MIYKDYLLDTKPNEWGYFEAISTLDCDAYILRDKTQLGLIDQINEL